MKAYKLKCLSHTFAKYMPADLPKFSFSLSKYAEQHLNHVKFDAKDL
jgi:hypothetical protein